MGDADAEEWFIRNYLTTAWERFEAIDAFERGWFWRNGRYGRHGLDFFEDGRIMLILDGDPETVIETESDRWDSLVADGRIDSWEREPFAEIGYNSVYEKAIDNVGETGADLFMTLKPLLTRTSLDMYEAFDEQIPMVGDVTDQNPKGIGFWVVFNTLAKQHGYDWYDEIDGCTKATKNRLRSLAAHRSEEVAQEKLQETIEELREFSDELSEWNNDR